MVETDVGYILCDECSLGREDVEWRRECLKELGDWQPDYCTCEKVNEYRFFYGGRCEDGFVRKPKKLKHGRRIRGRAYRRIMRMHKDKRLRGIITMGQYNPHAGYLDHQWVGDDWVPIEDHIKYPKNSHKQRFLKRRTSHVVRKSELHGKGDHYRKYHEYWWEIY